jgi:hypothetical protein
MQRSFHHSSAPIFAALVGALVACGSSTGQPGASGAPSASASGVAPDPGTTSGDPKTASATKPIAAGVDPAIVATLRTAGFELDTLPALESLHENGHPRMRAIMKTFTMALGTTCDGCHVAGAQTDDEFRVMTPRKKVAAQMYARFVGELQKKDGHPIYCDTCHQGRIKFLDRSDNDALTGWMQQNLVDGLARKDGKDHGCATCHGTPFNGPMLDAWRE